MEQLDLLNASPIMLLPVRITPRKNIELALHVLAMLRETYPWAALIITGPLGPHNPANVQYLQKLRSVRTLLSLDENVFFLAELVPDYLPDEVVSDFYKLADALFLPSREEGFGIPVLEAGLAGIPVFCADIPPLRDLGMDYAHYFSPDGSPSDIASMVLEQVVFQPVVWASHPCPLSLCLAEIYRKKIDLLLRKGAGSTTPRS